MSNVTFSLLGGATVQLQGIVTFNPNYIWIWLEIGWNERDRSGGFEPQQP